MSLEQDQNAPAVVADQQELPPPPVMDEAPPPAAVTNAQAPRRSACPHHPPEHYGWNLRREECSNWLTMEQGMNQLEHAQGNSSVRYNQFRTYLRSTI